MTRLILSRQQAGAAVASGSGGLLGSVRPITNPDTIRWIIRYTFYAFVFSLPFEQVNIGIGGTLPKFFGLALATFGLLQPRLCYKSAPRAFWCFVAYLSVFVLFGTYLMFTPLNVPNFSSEFIGSVFKLVQLVILFWISYNLMKQEQVINGMLWALACSTILLAILQVLGITSDVSKGGRVAALDGGPNGLATMLSLGLLALFGLAYGREKHDWKGRLLFWLGSGLVALCIVQTGSRGGTLALAGTLSVFLLRGKSLGTKLKFGLITVVGIGFLIVASYQIDAVRRRWEESYYEQRFAGREYMYPAAIAMILESPVVGWGPVNHAWEFGPRVGREYRDEHNLYLSLLAEVGLLGAMPFFAGLWLCWRAAWSARHSFQGILPLVMLFFLLAANMKGTLHKHKYFWLVLSYALVSSSYAPRSPRLQAAVLTKSPRPDVVGGRGKLVKVSGRARPRASSHSSKPFRRS